MAKDTKTIMDAGGIDEKLGAHSLRSSTASKLVERGVPELNIVHHARWSGTSVFRKFYERANLKDLNHWHKNLHEDRAEALTFRDL